MICIIDFDGTLFKNDFFLEVFFKTMVERPFYLFKVCVSKKFNLIDIKIALLADLKINCDVSFLINTVVTNWIEDNKNKFTNIYLVSASPDFFIKSILKDQQIFDDIFGSVEINLKGIEKLKFIQEKWGSNFTYIGDSKDDIPIFKIAKDAFKIINNKFLYSPDFSTGGIPFNLISFIKFLHFLSLKIQALSYLSKFKIPNILSSKFTPLISAYFLNP